MNYSNALTKVKSASRGTSEIKPSTPPNRVVRIYLAGITKIVRIFSPKTWSINYTLKAKSIL